MQKSILLCLFGALLLTVGCSKKEDATEDATVVEIRLKNVGDSNYTEIMITGSCDGVHSYEDIAPGEVTTYQVYDCAYSYAAMRLQKDGEEYFLQPIDFVGEQELDNGKYTYELDAAKTATGVNWIYLELKKD